MNERKIPIIQIDDALEKYKSIPVFQEKLDEANKTLQSVGLPKARKK